MSSYSASPLLSSFFYLRFVLLLVRPTRLSALRPPCRLSFSLSPSSSAPCVSLVLPSVFVSLPLRRCLLFFCYAASILFLRHRYFFFFSAPCHSCLVLRRRSSSSLAPRVVFSAYATAAPSSSTLCSFFFLLCAAVAVSLGTPCFSSLCFRAAVALLFSAAPSISLPYLRSITIVSAFAAFPASAASSRRRAPDSACFSEASRATFRLPVPLPRP